MIERMEIIPDRCRACRRCEMACIAAHHDISIKDAMKRRDEFVPRVQVIKAEGLKTSVRCRQCNPAPCCTVCPAGALVQDEEGRISMNEELCIACEMCVKACPYGTISMDTCHKGDNSVSHDGRQVAVRCDMCRQWRKNTGKQITACMEVCPFQALAMRMPDGTLMEMPKPEKKPVEKARTESVASAQQAVGE